METINNNETVAVRPMTPAYLFRIWDFQQKLSARTAIRKADRMKKSLTMKEKYNKLAQMGTRLRYKQVTFVFTDGMGYLGKADGTGIAGATITDFCNEVRETYGKVFKWA